MIGPQRLAILGPKAQPFTQRRAQPWKTRKRKISVTAQRANDSFQENCSGRWPETRPCVATIFQGFALRWRNRRPFGAHKPDAHKPGVHTWLEPTFFTVARLAAPEANGPGFIPLEMR